MKIIAVCHSFFCRIPAVPTKIINTVAMRCPIQSTKCPANFHLEIKPFVQPKIHETIVK